ncbi:MAG: ADP-dependent NAD(P)H-hydrate dehydratase / NAD(P)H-hydrate epimerase [Solirubrobacterales bacterium]|nr:ADP-dependent NAD(P)H-hydrate dehydratase / NAD(P)H-hydrate epimerase [Solirubrobacterales bacterium]
MEPWLSPLFDADGIRAVDRWAIEEEEIAEAELMDAAGTALAEAVAGLAPQGPVRIVCGKGNNGGDGLIAARRLGEMGFDVAVLELAEEESGDLDGWLEGTGVVVDAIFGTGFAGAPRAPADAVIDAINRCGAPVVACDIASGVDASSGEVTGVAVEAALTVSFHAAKIGHRIAPGKWHTGELRVVPIGIPDGAPGEPLAGTIGPEVLAMLPARGPRSTKFSSGQVVVAGGSRGLTGAVQMSSGAAIRAGAGYATVAVPADLEPIFESGQPEVMSAGCPGGDGCLAPASLKAVLRTFERAAAGVLGPGMGRDPGSVELAREAAAAIEAPLVIDADGLNAFAGELQRIAERTAPTVLTPHAGELGRLLGRSSEEIGAKRLAAAREAARQAAAIVVLKGDDTIVTDGERVAVNALSAPGLATAGTGDVLSGITAATLARGLEPFAAACAAVLAHARAGRDAARRIGAAESVIATDVIESIPAGMRPGAAVE